MISKRKQLLVTALAAGALALTACSGQTPAGNGNGAAVAQSFAVAGNYPVTSLDSYGQYSADAGTGFVAKQIYDTLMVSDGKGDYVSHLATSWKGSDGGKVWTFALRDAKFSDGTPFTSADVVGSIARLVAGGGPLAATWKPITVAAPDAHTVTLTSGTGGVSILTYIPQLQIGPASEMSQPGFFNKPVGLGPFMVSSFTSNQEVDLVPNPDYWGKAAVAQDVKIKTITDISARITALMNNEVQAIWGVPDDQFSQLKSDKSLNTKVQPGYSQFTMWMNPKQPGLKDYKVREAIWKAINWSAIQKALYPYSATLSKAPVSQAVAGAGSFSPYTYSPSDAKKLLASAGYPNGLSVSLQYDSSHPDFPALVAAMKSDLAKVGVTLDVQAKEHAVWLKDLLALNFGINVQTTGTTTGDPTTDLARLYTCAANRTGFCSDSLDQLIAAGNAATSPATRTADFIKVQKSIWDNAIGMFPMDVAIPYAWSKSLSGFVPDPANSPDLSRVKVVSAK